MHSVVYGKHTIDYNILVKDGLKSHYISVEKGTGVTLKGKEIPIEKANQLILKKARWIIEKLELVSSIGDNDIVTGSRVQYLGRKYYVEILIVKEFGEIKIDFNESKFKVKVIKELNEQAAINQAFEDYFTEKAIEKITPRIKKWSKKTGLSYNKIYFRKLEKSWGSCTPSNNIIINTEAIKLPYSLIDYLIVHELVHTEIKKHNKMFWAELSKHIPKWKELDDRMYGMKL